ncbi:MAG: hypothetical protein ACRDXB_16920 [Actinomycetes bacterium]
MVGELDLVGLAGETPARRVAEEHAFADGQADSQVDGPFSRCRRIGESDEVDHLMLGDCGDL